MKTVWLNPIYRMDEQMSEPYRFEDFPESPKPVVRVRATPELIKEAAQFIDQESQKADCDEDFEYARSLAQQLRQSIETQPESRLKEQG